MSRTCEEHGTFFTACILHSLIKKHTGMSDDLCVPNVYFFANAKLATSHEYKFRVLSMTLLIFEYLVTIWRMFNT